MCIVKHLCRAIQTKRRGILTFNIVLHDNVSTHTALSIPTLLEHFNWELFVHPPYNPVLPQSDYHMFNYLLNL
jgi:hypothetical protein